MVNPLKTEKKSTTYLILVWVIINTVLMLLMLPEDFLDLNNWIELVLWSSSIVGLLSMKKWGAAFVTFTLCYTLSTNVGILIYYQIWLNAIRVIINVPLIVYMFRRIFADEFQ